MIGMGSYVQAPGFTIGQNAIGAIMEYVDGCQYVRFYQYLSNVITFTGTLTIGGVTTSTTSTTIYQSGLTTISSTTTQSFTSQAYSTSDQPITTIAYAILIIFVCLSICFALRRSPSSMLAGLTIGTVIAIALGLLPIWLIIAVIILFILVLFFARQSSGEM